MRIDEVTNGLRTFTARVRAKSATSDMLVKTTVVADGFSQARAILLRWFGDGNVYTISESQQVAETAGGTKTLSPEELRVKSLSDQAKKLQDQAKQERARQTLAKAQQRMAKANRAAAA